MTPPTHLRAAIAALAALAGLTLADGWLDAVVALAWVAGGLADYLWTRDRNGDGKPDGPAWVAQQLGWTEAETLDALRELRRIGPSALVWLRRVAEIRYER